MEESSEQILSHLGVIHRFMSAHTAGTDDLRGSVMNIPGEMHRMRTISMSDNEAGGPPGRPGGPTTGPAGGGGGGGGDGGGGTPGSALALGLGLSATLTLNSLQVRGKHFARGFLLFNLLSLLSSSHR